MPPTHALWIPARHSHTTEVSRPGRGYGVLTPLLRELIIHLDRRQDPTAVTLLLSLLEPVPGATFHVPLPEDARIRVIAEALIADPADQRDLAAWAHETNSGVRTITRLFTAETG